MLQKTIQSKVNAREKTQSSASHKNLDIHFKSFEVQ